MKLYKWYNAVITEIYDSGIHRGYMIPDNYMHVPPTLPSIQMGEWCAFFLQWTGWLCVP